MYALADRLDPDTYHALARATFAEMALAGVTCVGEFHYLHHGPGGARYDDPNEMGHRLLAAAAEAGIRITLLDTVYLILHSGWWRARRARSGASATDRWTAGRPGVTGSGPAPTRRIGAAVHSVRAVPAGRARRRSPSASAGRPVHVHLSEQRAENEACLAGPRPDADPAARRGRAGRRRR